jgi:hypothetical protein
MAIGQQAAQQIAALLVQSAGLPGGQAAEIAQRLFASSGSGKVDRSARTITSDNVSTAFRNQFRPSEQRPFPSQDGQDGKDGTRGQGGRNGVAGAAGSSGADGAAGQDGVVDYDAIQKYLEGLLNGLIPGTDGLDALRKALNDILDRLKKLEDKKDPELKLPECGGMFRGRDICSILQEQANKFKEINRRLEKIEKNFKELDERVKAIEKYMPPVDCP